MVKEGRAEENGVAPRGRGPGGCSHCVVVFSVKVIVGGSGAGRDELSFVRSNAQGQAMGVQKIRICGSQRPVLDMPFVVVKNVAGCRGC